MQATLLLAIAWIADRLLVRWVWPQLLLVLWLAALVRFFLPPDLCSPWSVTAPIGEPVRALAGGAPSGAAAAVALAAWIVGATVVVAARVRERAKLRARLAPVEPTGLWARALVRAARTVGARRIPRVAEHDALAAPAVLGPLRAVLLVPRGTLARAPTRRDEHALVHELAHLVRGDPWLDELCALVRAALWFHPLAWIAVARIRALTEIACDQTVARALAGDVRFYRDTLVLAARHALTVAAPRSVRAFTGARATILVRIERLERCVLPPRPLAPAVATVLAAALASCVLPMARDGDARAQARAVLASERAGELRSCFSLQAAAMVLAADADTPSPR